MTRGGSLISRWKSPDDFKRWLAHRFDHLVAAELREPRTLVDPFPITTPELNAGAVAEHFAAVRAWAGAWTELDATQPDLEITWTDWDTRNFGRVRIPRAVRALSADGVARSIGRLHDLTAARQRFHSILAADIRLAAIAHQWPRFTAMAEPDFRLLCRFLSQTAAQGIARVRLRELPCAGMHTKFLEQHRALLVPAMAALNIPPNPDARTWAGKLGFIEDETQQFELRDLDGHLLPYPHFSLPIEQLATNPVGKSAASTLSGVVIVENQATFRSLPTMAGVLAIFGHGNAVRTLGRASWLKTRPLLYAGDLDHAGFLMVAALRRDGLQRLETGLMDSETASALKDYWVADTSRPGTKQAYDGLTDHEHQTQQLMATGPWRLEQERIPFDTWVNRLECWRQSLR